MSRILEKGKKMITVNDVKAALKLFNVDSERATNINTGDSDIVCGFDSRDKRILNSVFGDYKIIERVLCGDLLLEFDTFAGHEDLQQKLREDLAEDLKLIEARFY